MACFRPHTRLLIRGKSNRYLVLSLIAYLLAHWGHLSQERASLPRWGAALMILEEILAETVIEGPLMEIEERDALLRSHSIEV